MFLIIIIYWLCPTACGILVPKPDLTCDVQSGSEESSPLDCQGSPQIGTLFKVSDVDGQFAFQKGFTNLHSQLHSTDSAY